MPNWQVRLRLHSPAVAGQLHVQPMHASRNWQAHLYTSYPHDVRLSSLPPFFRSTIVRRFYITISIYFIKTIKGVRVQETMRPFAEWQRPYRWRILHGFAPWHSVKRRHIVLYSWRRPFLLRWNFSEMTWIGSFKYMETTAKSWSKFSICYNVLIRWTVSTSGHLQPSSSHRGFITFGKFLRQLV